MIDRLLTGGVILVLLAGQVAGISLAVTQQQHLQRTVDTQGQIICAQAQALYQLSAEIRPALVPIYTYLHQPLPPPVRAPIGC